MRYLSVCSGIEAATVAWHLFGWTPAGFAEIDPFPSAVLAHHYPQVKNHGDFTDIQASEVGPIDLLVGGTPCQSFSVAGLRGGLGDRRGNLALEYLKLAQRTRPRWLVWENVPGVLSSSGGRDFGSILGGMVELGYGFAYRVLDAQYVRVDGFGRAVPQRRRRVFVVGHFGDWRRAAAVLFERESLQGNPAPRRQPGERLAPTLSARTKGGGGLGTDFDLDGGLVTASVNGHGQYDADLPTLRSSGGDTGGGSETLVASTGHVSHCLNGGGMGRLDYETETLVAHSKNGGVFDAEPIMLAIRGRNGGHDIECRQDGTSNAILTPNGGRAGMGVGAICAPVCFSAKDHGADAMSDLSPTLRAGGFNKSHANAGVMPAIAYRTTGNDGCYETGDVTACLNTNSDPSQITLVQSWRVRRLTPRECERLQGFPDGYTDVPYRRRNHTPDGPRYKALGNSMATNCMRWIGMRIAMVDALPGEIAA